MLCVNPLRPRKSVEWPCGQCLSCRLNARRVWTARILLECLAHASSSFVTLTYADEFLPEVGLSDAHWRALTKGIGFRYFGVGEYGRRRDRAHYHLLLFGCEPHRAENLLAAEKWPYGYVQVDASPIGVACASYVAGYTVKKWTKLTDHNSDGLNGRRPEFARMSRRPAIGWPGLAFLRRWLVTPVGQKWMEEHRDVPQGIRLPGRGVYPLGRTMVSKLREACDIPSDDPERRQAQESRMLAINYDALQRLARERTRQANYDVLKAREESRQLRELM